MPGWPLATEDGLVRPAGGHARGADVVLAWIVLLGAPLGAGALAARRCRENGGPVPPGDTGILRQSTAAGLLTTLVGALFVTVAGPARSR